jgi:hypothetical protein
MIHIANLFVVMFLPLRNHHDAYPKPIIYLHSCDKPIVYCLFYCKVEGFPILQLLPALTYLCGYILHTRHTWKEILSSVSENYHTIRLTSFGQWSQLWELGIIWFSVLHKLHHFQEAFKLELCTSYLIFSFIRVWMDKKIHASHFFIQLPLQFGTMYCLLW